MKSIIWRGVLTMLLRGCFEPGDAVAGVKLDTASLSMAIDETKTLAATVEPVAIANQTVLWSSNNLAVAIVNDTGLVIATGKEQGTTIITVKSVADDAKSATCEATVVNLLEPGLDY
jgi:uncharacterized protein YjdB